MRAGTETGSLINHLMTRGTGIAPEVGMGATVCWWTDRMAGTIIHVTATQVHVQLDRATRTDKNGASEHQEYSYEADPDGEVIVFRLRKKGWGTAKGMGIMIGGRHAYHDYSF
jgi:hypothetical protein